MDFNIFLYYPTDPIWQEIKNMNPPKDASIYNMDPPKDACWTYPIDNFSQNIMWPGIDDEYLLPPKGSLFEHCSAEDFQKVKMPEFALEQACWCGCKLPFICNKQEMLIKKQIIKKKVYPKKNRPKGPIFPKEYYTCSKCYREHYNGKKCTRNTY
jgi:hypothetical protein